MGNVITLDTKPCAKCAYARIKSRDKIGIIYRCVYYWDLERDNLLVNCIEERRPGAGCGPKGSHFIRSSTR